jgi:hypothetical protein
MQHATIKSHQYFLHLALFSTSTAMLTTTLVLRLSLCFHHAQAASAQPNSLTYHRCQAALRYCPLQSHVKRYHRSHANTTVEA